MVDGQNKKAIDLVFNNFIFFYLFLKQKKFFILTSLLYFICCQKRKKILLKVSGPDEPFLRYLMNLIPTNMHAVN